MNIKKKLLFLDNMNYHYLKKNGNKQIEKILFAKPDSQFDDAYF